MTIVRAYPRLHFALADLGRATLRAYGGAGVLLEGPYLDIEAVLAPSPALVGFERIDKRGQSDIATAIGRLEAALPDSPSFQVSLLTDVHEHVGLGSKTAMIMAVLQASAAAGGYRLSRAEFQALSGRGGASGVGIHAFFEGGFVMDGGHPQADVPILHPSASREPVARPPLLTRLEVPACWRFRLVLPGGERLAGEAEATFFESATPVPAEEVLETIALLHHGIAPAIATGETQSLAKSLAAVQACGFKARELDAQPAIVRSLIAQCGRIGPTGLSSMGPLVFVIVESDAQEEELDAVIMAADAIDLGAWPARSSGFEIIS